MNIEFEKFEKYLNYEGILAISDSLTNSNLSLH